MNPIEETFVKAFIARDSRDRWLQFLPSQKNRGKVVSRLSGAFRGDLDRRFVYDKRNPPPQVVAQVETLLTEWKKANPKQLCHVIAIGCGEAQDETDISLTEVEAKLPMACGAVAIIIPDRLAYYYTENYLNKEPHFILFRPTGLG